MTVFVDLIIHAQLVIGKRCLTPPAISQNLEALINQALVVELLEGPEHALGVVLVESLVVVIEIHPARLTGDIAAPVFGVFQYRCFAKLVELGNSEVLDLGAARDAQETLCLNLGRKTMRVPTKSALNSVTAHRLITRDKVLRVTG